MISITNKYELVSDTYVVFIIFYRIYAMSDIEPPAPTHIPASQLAANSFLFD